MKGKAIPNEFIQAIPKTDLHCHLDGSIRIKTLIELSQEQDIELPSYDEDELKQMVFKSCYCNLEEYLKCFSYTTEVLRNKNALNRVAYELAVDKFQIGVRYFEVRFAPQLNTVPGALSIEDVLSAVNTGLQTACNEFNGALDVVNGNAPSFAYGIIVCGMRFFTKDFSPYFENFLQLHQNEDVHRIYGLASMALVTTAYNLKVASGIPIVALDIAGAESGYPAEDHLEAYKFAHKKFLYKTVHAGEGYGPESIYQAVTDLHAERIGHGFHVFHANEIQLDIVPEEKQSYVNGLANYLGNMRICIEVCLSSNLQTIPQLQNDISRHPAKEMIAKKLAISLCTDNMTVSHTNIVKEIRLACDNFDLSPQQLKDIVITGFKRSFMSRNYQEKRLYNHKIISYYEKLELEYGLSADSMES